MKNLYTLISLFFISLQGYSQHVIPFSDDFEGQSNWTIINGQVNEWFIDTAVYAGGNHSIYISNTGGSTNTYFENMIAVTHFYSDFIVPLTSCVQLEVDWQCGANGGDGFEIWLVPLQYVPQAGVKPTPGPGFYLLSTPANSAAFQHVTIGMGAIPNDTVRLLFTWFNDDAPGSQPPAAIDNITITSQPGPANDYPCNATPLVFGSWITGSDSCAGNLDEPEAPQCFNVASSMELQTVWYSFIAPASGCVSIMTMSSYSAGRYIGLYGGVATPVMCDSGATLNYIECSNTSPPCGSDPGFPAELSIDSLTPGLIYYIMLDGISAVVGRFDIMIIDGGPNCSNVFPPVYGLDCDVPLTACADSIMIPDPGFNGIGTVCDFGTGYCIVTGERRAAWFRIDILQAGQLMFDIVYNNISVGPPVDYDFIIWRMDSAGGSVSCQQLATDTIPPAACSFASQQVTGCYIGGNSPPAYPGFDDGYEPPVPVLPGEVYYLAVINYTLSNTGFKLSFRNTTPGVLDPCPVSVTEIPGDDFVLSLNPNPVTGQSTLGYTLPSHALVQTEIVNILGQRIFSSAEKQLAGIHSLTINKNDFKPGIYLIRVTTKDKTAVVRMVVN